EIIRLNNQAAAGNVVNGKSNRLEQVSTLWRAVLAVPGPVSINLIHFKCGHHVTAIIGPGCRCIETICKTRGCVILCSHAHNADHHQRCSEKQAYQLSHPETS